MGSTVDTLHSAAFRGDSDCVKRLLRKHDVSERGDQGDATPLHAAGACATIAVNETKAGLPSSIRNSGPMI